MGLRVRASNWIMQVNLGTGQLVNSDDVLKLTSGDDRRHEDAEDEAGEQQRGHDIGSKQRRDGEIFWM